MLNICLYDYMSFVLLSRFIIPLFAKLKATRKFLNPLNHVHTALSSFLLNFPVLPRAHVASISCAYLRIKIHQNLPTPRILKPFLSLMNIYMTGITSIMKCTEFVGKKLRAEAKCMPSHVF